MQVVKLKRGLYDNKIFAVNRNKSGSLCFINQCEVKNQAMLTQTIHNIRQSRADVIHIKEAQQHHSG